MNTNIATEETITVTLPATTDWTDAVGDDGHACLTPYWETTDGTITAWVGGVEFGHYREDLDDLRTLALALLAAVTAAERYQARRDVTL